MRIRLLISDVDGTLVDHAKHLAPATVAAARRLRDAGVGFTLISARPPSGILPLAAALDVTEPIAAFNGGIIQAIDGRIVDHHSVPAQVMSGMFALAVGSGAEPWLFADGRWFARTDGGNHIDRERLSAMQEPVLVDDMQPFFDRTDKLTWVSDDEPGLRALAARGAAAFGDQATIVQSQTYYLDVTATAANKGDGVATLARAFGCSLGEVAVIGDQWNDVPMFERAGVAIAMAQGPAGVRAKADHVTRSNDQDGVAHAIDTILLPMLDKRL